MSPPDPPGDEPTAAGVPPPAAFAFQVPTRLGAYRLLREIGRGGMGMVFEAEDETLRRRVAVKVLGPWLSGHADAEARIEAEARTLATLRHPGIVQVLGAGREGALFYFAMELLEGAQLSSAFGRAAPDAEQVLDIGVRVAEAVLAAHDIGIIHRDLKPQNIYLGPARSIKVADFGLARVLDDPRFTATGQLLGTPAYMSPEQVMGQKASAASDVYSLGVVLFELIAGRPPFEGDSPFAVAMKHAQVPPPDIRGINPSVPAALGGLVMRLLAKQPADRPAMREVHEALVRLLADHRAIDAVLRPLRARAPGGEAGAADAFRSGWGTALFADIAGFTRIAEAASPDLVGRSLSAIFTAMRTAIEASGGRVVQYLGDCCLAVFLGDDPADVVARSLAASDDLHRRTEETCRLWGFEVRLRIGINAGDMLFGPLSDGRSYYLLVLGDTVNLASKVESSGTAGVTSITEAVVRWLPATWTAEPAGEIRYRDRSLAIFAARRA